jgi:hypothetical protein
MISPLPPLFPTAWTDQGGDENVWGRSFAWIFGEVYNRRDVGQRALYGNLKLAVHPCQQRGVDILKGFHDGCKEVVNGGGECHSGI